MSEANGKADDGTKLYVPVSTLYHEHTLREAAEGRAADAERRAERAEKRLAELLELTAKLEGDSPLGKRAMLELELHKAGLRKPSAIPR